MLARPGFRRSDADAPHSRADGGFDAGLCILEYDAVVRPGAKLSGPSVNTSGSGFAWAVFVPSMIASK